MALFPDSLLTDIQSRGEAVNGSFLVSILVRDDEPQIQVFKQAMEEWFQQVPRRAAGLFRDRLTSTQNDVFFQGFAELAIHQLVRREALDVLEYPRLPDRPFYRIGASDQEREFSLTVVSFIPEGHPHYARRAYLNFIEELNRIRHHYRFAVFLRRWLPPDFDPGIVRRALESWFERLDSDPHGGVYAEYRDGGVHVEFSVLGRVSKNTDKLVGFYLAPLETQNVLDNFRRVIARELARYEEVGDPKCPLVIVLFNNDEWNLSINYIYDFFYGKPRMSFNWRTKAGRRELIRDFSTPFARSVFNSPDAQNLGAVILAEKLWKENGVDLKLLCCHNPWCRRPLPDGFFSDHTTLKPLAGTSPDEVVVRWSHLDETTIQLT